MCVRGTDIVTVPRCTSVINAWVTVQSSEATEVNASRTNRYQRILRNVATLKQLLHSHTKGGVEAGEYDLFAACRVHKVSLPGRSAGIDVSRDGRVRGRAGAIVASESGSGRGK